MGVKVGEFFLEMVIDAASGNLSVRQLVGTLGELDVASVTSVGILGKVAEGLWGLAKAATDTAVELTALHDLTGTDPKIVQQWEKAAHQVVGHTGAIIKAIQSVQEMNKRIEAGGGTPAVVGNRLGMTPTKGYDKEGHPILKNAMDYLSEMAKPGSRYRALTPDLQQGALDEMLGGGAGADAFRIIKAMMAGNFHPEKMPAMDDKQVRDLNAVKMEGIKVEEQMVGIFQKLVLGGGDVAKVLEIVSKDLVIFDAWLDKHKEHSYVDDAKNIKSGLSKPGAFTDLMDFTHGFNLRRMILDTLPRDVRMPATTGGALGELRGKLDIDLKSNGKHLGTKTAYIDRAGTMRDFWDVTQTMGNTP